VSPFAVMGRVPGVTAVFKRLFEPYCEVQALFARGALPGPASAAPANATGESSSHEAPGDVPWASLLEIAQAVLADPPASLSALRAALREDAPPQKLEIEIFRADRAAVALPGGGVAVIQGDALVTAHYRLGIGVNEAFRSTARVARLVDALSKAPEGPGRAASGEAGRLLALAHRRAAAPAVDAMVEKQLQTMFYEARCRAVVFAGQVYLPSEDPARRGRFDALSDIPSEELEFVDAGGGRTCPRRRTDPPGDAAREHARGGAARSKR
jgi:hypothetical protein